MTNQTLCRTDFWQRVEEFAACRPAGIILREKDLEESVYKNLARQVINICETYQVPCILHNFVSVALELGAENIHLPLPVLRELDEGIKSQFQNIGASCHSVEEAMEAKQLGCTYIIAGHIFATDCKRGLPPRGTEFLRQVCQNVTIPVYGIGGICENNIHEVMGTGARGACVMSGWMQCENVAEYVGKIADKDWRKP